jgi:peptidyl-prolyl cis-trans isomerase SurA
MMEDRLNYMVGQIGSIDKVINYYNKSSEEKIQVISLIFWRNEINFKYRCGEVEITPEEVRNFSKQYKEELPLLVQKWSGANCGDT